MPPHISLFSAIVSLAACGDDTVTLLFVNPRTRFGAASVQEDGACRSLPEHTPSFEEFMKKYNRSYSGEAEYKQRLALYQARVETIHKQNCRPDSWTATVNLFSDRSAEELKRLHGWKGASKEHLPAGAFSFLQTDKDTNRRWPFDMSDNLRTLKNRFERHQAHHYEAVDDHVYDDDVNEEFRHEERFTPNGEIARRRDWRGLMATTTPLFQAECGSCWAFAAATVLGAHSELYGEKRTFSPQHLIQCVANPRKCGGTGGCDGATVELALEHVQKHGLATAVDLPYTGDEAECFDGPTAYPEGHKLHNKSTVLQMRDAMNLLVSLLQEKHNETEHGQVAVKTTAKARAVQGLLGWKNPLHNNYHALLRALQDGPVAAAVEATDAWHSYHSGIAGDDCQAAANINHAVVLVGYSHLGSMKYWIIQNSWGPGWGMNGFMHLLSRGNHEDQFCGWDTDPQTGSGCADGPSKVYVCGTCGILYDPVQPVFKK